MSTDMPAVGQKAPDFSLPATTIDTMSLRQVAGKPVVLYFYPKADTPGCTTEACAFRDAAAEYKQAGVVVLGVSPDELVDVKNFAEKHHLNFPLLADANHAVCSAYGVWGERSTMGRKFFGVARTTFVIDRDGKIAHVFEKVKPDGHDKEVMEKLRELKLISQ